MEPASAPVDDVHVPGCAHLREVVAQRAAGIRTARASVGGDAVAGLTVAVSSVPDAMAESVLIGVNPLYGLYAGIVGPVVGALLSRTGLMVITTTSAAALVAAQAVVGVPTDERPAALFLMVVIAGAIMLLFGLLRLGRLTRFVSFSVMTGFLAGISILLVLSQLPTVLGFAAAGDSVPERAYALLRAPGDVNLASAALAAVTLTVALGLGRTRISPFAPLLGVALATAIATLAALDVTVVADIGDIRSGVPTPALPSLAGGLQVLGGAFSIAVIVLVQGAGVSQSLPRAKGEKGGLSRDFVAQGAANVASGIFRGIPVGASLGSSALNVVAGARSRAAALFAGLWMLLIVLFLSGLVSRVAMPALGALLILAGIRALRPADVRDVWQSGWPARIGGGMTFLATILLPLVVAVGIGVALAALLHLVRAAGEVTLVELVEERDGRVRERAPPRRIDTSRAIVLDAYGNLFYAGARTLERRLPEPTGEAHPVVILRMRGQRSIGSTLADVLGDYGDSLASSGGRLYLTGVTPAAYRQLERSPRFRLSGPIRVYPASVILGESTRRALGDAEAWLLLSNRDEARSVAQ